MGPGAFSRTQLLPVMPLPRHAVTASTAVAGELQDLLPHRPQKVIFRIGYFTAEDSAETLRQAVEEDAQSLLRRAESLPSERLL